MTWFKVDDTLFGNLKSREAGVAMATWVMAGSYCSQALTDGFVPAWVCQSLPDGPAHAEALVDAGLWDEVEGGWQFHDWTQANFTKVEVEAQRQATKDRQQKWREKRHADTVGHTSSDESRNALRNALRNASRNGVTNTVNNAAPTRPDPTVLPTEELPPSSLRSEGPPTAAAAVPAPPRKPTSPTRGTRLPDGWQPSPDLVEQMHTEVPGVNLREQHDRFVDHFASAPGSKGVKVDWSATWRNWMRRSTEFGGGGGSRNRPTPTENAKSWAALAPGGAESVSNVRLFGPPADRQQQLTPNTDRKELA